MFSNEKVSLVILFIVCSLIMAACGTPSPPPGEPPAGTPPGDEQEQADQASGERPSPDEQPANAPAEPDAAQQPPPDVPSNQAEPENPPDLAVAAETLGITKQELMEALGPPPPDLAAAAATLGITQEELQGALAAAGTGDAAVSQPTESIDSAPSEPGELGPPPDLAVVAELLGLTEQELKDALGPPPPDFTAAAATLGITEEELHNAMAATGGADQAAGGGADQAPASEAQTDSTAPESTTAPTEQPAVTTDPTSANGYPIVDTGQVTCYNNQSAMTCAQAGAGFDGQDAQYSGLQPGYVANGDGTVTDVNTGLMWQKDPGDKMTYNQALAKADSFNLAGYDDWRLPTIKELYSLILFSGSDVSICTELATCTTIPFIDTNTFNFEYGNTAAGERVIDSQFTSSTKYVTTTMNGEETAFGVNFADGRIKGYGLILHGREKTFFVLYVRGNPGYGLNNFVDNGNGTVTDQATGLMWLQADSGTGMAWAEALAYCQNLDSAGYSDWRLPDAKELQSIVDYSRSPATTNSAAINPIFTASTISDESGNPNYPFYWSSTTHTNIVTVHPPASAPS